MLETLKDFLDGKKTYLATLGLMLWVVIYLKLPGAKDTIGPENFQLVAAALAAAAGISYRAAVAKVPDKTVEAHAESGVDPTPPPPDKTKEAKP